ncbi:MAG: NAD(P)-dependent alcohol dehydrogenase [Deltaproteobacteria bacterium]|nr:NAD(P)-dependent alcohol dehydrogenase [Deltaproteobacteria bacterium]
MIKCSGYAAAKAKDPLAPFNFERRQPGPKDVFIEILYCGVCHSDIHQARDEWGNAVFPMVPGHEIVGRVKSIGSEVTKFKIGDLAGVGCFVDSCRQCSSCKEGYEQYCTNHISFTYNGFEQDKKTPTFGGYSDTIVVDENYTLRVPSNLDPSGVAPLLCAGITTYSPLRHWKAGKGQKIGVVGLGGLGHMAVKFASSFGAEVTVFSHSPGKKEDALGLGASNFVISTEEKALNALQGQFDLMIDTVSAQHDVSGLASLLKRDGTLIMVGIPETPLPLNVFPLISKRRQIAGSLIGGIRETQEMLDYCGAHNITSDVEVIPIQQINEAYDRTVKGDVRYRFVIDMKSLSR